MTLIELIEQGAAQLEAGGVAFGHGTNNAFDEAAWLVLWQLGLALDSPLEGPDSVANRVIVPAEYEKLASLFIARIESRKPAAYLTREAWLQGVPFYVDERVIVPRSFIAELLVEGNIDPWLSEQTTRVLDLCTGNGSLAVLAAMAYPDVMVTGSDVSADALAVARINVEKHNLQARITLVQSDGLTSPELQTRGPFDLILCNPPYVNSLSMACLPAEYHAEPALALDGNAMGGSDGMDFIRQLLIDAPQAMTEDGVLVLEIGNERENFEAAFPQLEPVWLETSAGEDQVLLLTRDALVLQQDAPVPRRSAMTSPTTFKRASSLEEFAAFKDLLLEYAGHGLDDPKNSTIWRDIEQLPGRYGAPSSGVVLVYVGDALAGCGAVVGSTTAGLAEIKRVYIRDTFRRQGLARALTLALIDLARQLDYATAAICTWPHNLQALGLYRQLGFEPIVSFREPSKDHLTFLGLPLANNTPLGLCSGKPAHPTSQFLKT